MSVKRVVLMIAVVVVAAALGSCRDGRLPGALWLKTQDSGALEIISGTPSGDLYTLVDDETEFLLQMLSGETGRQLWQQSFNQSGGIYALKAGEDSDIFARQQFRAGSTLVRRSHVDGELIWSRPLEDSGRMAVATGGGLVAVAAEYWLSLYEADGTRLWNTRMSRVGLSVVEITSSGDVVRGERTSNGRSVLQAYSGQDGVATWSIEYSRAGYEDYLARSGDLLVAIQEQGDTHYAAVAITPDGTISWTRSLPGTPWGLAAKSDGTVSISAHNYGTAEWIDDIELPADGAYVVTLGAEDGAGESVMEPYITLYALTADGAGRLYARSSEQNLPPFVVAFD